MPRVSVIVPGYNHAQYLPRRLDSILAQTFGDYEIHLLDDGSTDGSQAICREYARKHPCIRTHFREQNSGSTFRQWNAGVELAAGEYVWIAESDDWAHPRFLARLAGVLDTHPNVGLAYSASEIVDRDGRAMGFEWRGDFEGFDARRWTRDFVHDGLTECRDQLAYGETIPNASAVVFRRRLYRRAGGANPYVRMVGDWLMWSRMLCLADVAYVAEKLNFWRLHENAVREQLRKSGLYAFECALAKMVIVCHIAPSRAYRKSVIDAFTDQVRARSRTDGGRLSPRRVFANLQPLTPYPRVYAKAAACVAWSVAAGLWHGKT